jgi:hypothetical protein
MEVNAAVENGRSDIPVTAAASWNDYTSSTLTPLLGRLKTWLLSCASDCIKLLSGGFSPQRSLTLTLEYASLITLVLLFNCDYVLLVAYNLISHLMTICGIVLVYLIVYQLYGAQVSLNDENVGILFLVCLLSEFVSQCLVLDDKFTEGDFQSMQHYTASALIFTAINFHSGSTFRKNLWLTLLIGTTRFYGSVFFTALLPQLLCVYFTYGFAFGGVLLSIFLKHIESSTDNKSDSTLTAAQLAENETSGGGIRGLAKSSSRYLRSFFDLKSVGSADSVVAVTTTPSSATVTITTTGADDSSSHFELSSVNKLSSKSKRTKLSKEALLSRRRTSLPTIPLIAVSPRQSHANGEANKSVSCFFFFV